MKARITGKSQLRLSDLTRDYTFDIITDDGESILTSQTVTARPNEIVSKLQQVVSEYQTAYEAADDVEVGEEV